MVTCTNHTEEEYK